MGTALFWVIMRRLVEITDVSGLPICPVFRCEEMTHEEGTDSLSRNVGNYHYSPRNDPEQRGC